MLQVLRTFAVGLVINGLFVGPGYCGCDTQDLHYEMSYVPLEAVSVLCHELVMVAWIVPKTLRFSDHWNLTLILGLGVFMSPLRYLVA